MLALLSKRCGLVTVGALVYWLLCLCPAVCRAGIDIGTYYYPPYSMQEEQENIGLVFEGLDKIMQDAALPYKIGIYSLFRGLVLLRQGELGVFFPIADLRHQLQLEKEDIYYLGPIASSKITMFANKTKHTGQQIKLKNFKELRNKYSLAVENGSVIANLLLEHNIQSQLVGEDLQAAKMLQLQRVDLWATDYLSGIYQSFIEGFIENVDIVYEDFEIPLYIGISKKLPAAQFSKIIQSFVKLKQQQVFTNLQAAYIDRTEQFLKIVNSES